MRKNIKRLLSMVLCITMLLGALPVSAMGMEIVDTSGMVSVQQYADSGAAASNSGDGLSKNGATDTSSEAAQPDSGNNDHPEEAPEDEPETEEWPESAEPAIGQSSQKPEREDGWLQDYQAWVIGQARAPLSGPAAAFSVRAATSSPSYSLIEWGSGADSDALEFANSAWLNSPLPRIHLNGKIAFCAEWNGAIPSGNYEQVGTGNDPVIKQILANYDNSGESDADYAAAQVAIWAHLMNTSVATWGACPGEASADEIFNGDHDYSNLKYTYIEWAGGTQNLITYNVEDIPDIPEEYPEDEYEIKVETETSTETEVRHRTTYDYSDAIGQITVRKHDQDGNSLDDALFNIRVDFSDGSFIFVENWEVDNGARLFTWTHPEDNYDDATVTITEVQPPRYYEMDPEPQTAVVSPTYTRVTHVETWTVTIVTETTSSTVIEIASGDVVAESESSSSAETESDPQVEEYTDFIEGDRETSVTFVNTRITGNIEVLKKDANTGTPLAGATIHLWGDDLGEAGLIDMTAVTDADGMAYFNNLPPGTYVIQETQAPFSYNLNDEKQTVALQSGQTVRKEVANYRKDGLIIKKVDVDGKPLAGAVFELRRGSGEVLLSDTTDENGIIFRDYLAEGHYVIEELQAPHTHLIGDENIKEIYIYESDDNKQYTVTFVNLERPKIRIEKIDSETGAPLAGAVFRVAERGSKDYTDVTTGEDGVAIVENLNVNWYSVFELRAPTGYVLDETHYDIETTAGKVSTHVARNSSRPDLMISKIDSVTKEPLQGVVFEVQTKNGKSLGEFTTGADGLITLSDVDPNETYIITELRTLEGYHIDESSKEITLSANEDKIVPFENTPKNPIIIKKLDSITGEPIEDTTFLITKVNGEFVGEYTTGKQGYATAAGLDPGWYVIKEIRANSNYILSNEAKTVQLKRDEPAVAEFYNTRRTGLQIIKTDFVTGKPLEGVKFSVTEMNGALIGNYETDKDGLITIDGQEEKWVRVTETAPLPGYKPDAEPRLVELKAEGLTLVEYENKPYPIIEITKVDKDTEEPLEGVKVRLYDKQKREIGAFTTNADGLIMLSGMDGGQTLYVREVETIEGYVLEDSYHPVELEWGKTAKVRLENEIKPISVTIKKTGNHEALGGEIMRYDFSDIANTSELALDEFYFHDALPADAVRVGEVVTGTWSHDLLYDVTYKTNKSDDYEIAESGLHSNVSYDLDLSREALGLRRSEYVTDIKFEFGTVPAGFHEETGPSVYVTVLADLPAGYRIINRADAGGQKNGKWAIDKDTWITVVWNTPETKLPKTGF